MASSSLTFDFSIIEDGYFEDAMFIGIFCALQPYRLAWLLNKELELELTTNFDLVISQKKKDITYIYPVYEHLYSNKCHRIVLYKLLVDRLPLLPELKKIDYLLVIQTANLENDFNNILDKLKQLEDISLITVIEQETFKNLKNLII